MSEYIENESIAITPDMREAKGHEPYAAHKDEAPGEWAYNGRELPDAGEIGNMMDDIRRRADEPERLLESHLGIFTEPAPPGKMLDSQG